MIDYRVYVLNREEKLQTLLQGAFFLAGAGYIFFGSWVGAMVLALGTFWYPRIKQRQLQEKRQRELTAQFKDALYALASALGAGLALESAFQAALRDLRVLYPEEEVYILQEFEYLCRRIQLNEPVELVLADFAQRSGVEDVRNFAEVISICKRTGGNLVQVVKNTATIIGDKIEINQDINLLLTKQKFEQRILNVMPVVFIGLIKFGGSGYMDGLYSSPVGYALMGVALVILAASYAVSQKIMDIQVWEVKMSELVDVRPSSRVPRGVGKIPI